MTGGGIRSKRCLWAGEAPLVLASKSESRRALMTSAGLHAEIVAANIDERALERRFFTDGGSPEDLAAVLAEAKALAVSALRPEAYCLGADQTLTLGSTVMHKPRDFDEAAQSLAMLSGRTHRLISAFCVARSGASLVIDADCADLHMRTLDRQAIAAYLDLAGPLVLSSVGAYRIEGLGVNLFDRVEGDFATILGIPMFKLLAWLRRQHLVAL
ncbi:MAG: Maf family protein [Hyphomicrobiales bacterium]|nr:Maf family protein [Hyphomicrobiales bacterium]MBV8442030.1 Maf family protein [Hyphomicrobiales bacterium]